MIYNMYKIKIMFMFIKSLYVLCLFTTHCFYSATGVSSVRIIGDSPGAGRVEVNISGSWSTVCDDGWSLTEADVVCRQLGYTGATNFTTGVTTNNMFGIADQEQSIVTGNVGCTGHETTLFGCPGFNPNSPTLCASDHTEDVGVVCFCKYK